MGIVCICQTVELTNDVYQNINEKFEARNYKDSNISRGGVQNFKSEPKKISFMVYTIFIVQGRSFFNFIFNTKTAMRDIANFN